MIESKGHKITPIDGDLAVSRNAEIGGDADIHGKARVAGSLKVEGFLDAPHIKGVVKGLFATEEELKREYPNPRPGWCAIVLADDESGFLYLAKNREWEKQSEEAKPFKFIVDSINVFASKGELADETQRAQGAENILTQRIVNETVRATEAENEIKKNAVKFNRIGITGYADKLELSAATIDGDEAHYIDIPAATETKAGVVSAEDKKKFVKSITWNNDSDMNSFTTAGVYEIKGIVGNNRGNLPIMNTGENASFAARLVVTVSPEGDTTYRHSIGQTMVVSNSEGKETKVYTRNANVTSYDGGASYVYEWGNWGELQKNVNVDAVTSLDHLVDNGIYSGVLIPTGETFVLVVINNYAFASQHGTQKCISQFKYSVSPFGAVAFGKRVKIGNADFPAEWDILNRNEIDKMLEDAVKQAIANVVNGAPEAFDTLKEIADLIANDETGVVALANAISANAAAITAERTRAIGQEGLLNNAIAEEKARAEQAEQAIKDKAVEADSLNFQPRANVVALDYKTIEGVGDEITIPAATAEKAGVMSAEDKITLDSIPNEIDKIKDGDTIVGQAREIHSRNGKTVPDSFIVRTTAGSGTIGDGVASLKSVGGNIVKNLVDGTFKKGWTAGKCTVVINNGIIACTTSEAYGRYAFTINLISGHKYYVSTLVNGFGKLVQTVISSAYNANAETRNNGWTRISYITDTNLSSSFYIACSTGGHTFYATKPLLIDLTERFGVGKEPDKATCDKLFGTMDALPQGLTIAKPNVFTSTGFNQFNPDNVLEGKAIVDNVIVPGDKKIAVIPCLPCKVGTGENNGYCIHGDFGEDIKVYLTPLNPMEVEGELYMHELTKDATTDTYVPLIKGYMLVEVPTTANLCAHFLWSEDKCERDTYEPYFESKIELPDIPQMSEWGLAGIQAGGTLICDEIDFERGVYIKKIGSVDLGSLNWLKRTDVNSAGVIFNATNNLSYFLGTVIFTDTHTYSGVYETAATFNNLTASRDKVIGCNTKGNTIYIRDSAFNADALKGKLVYYLLKTPEEYPLPKVDNNYISSDYGVEQFDGVVPCNANNLYYMRSLAGETRNFLDRMYDNTAKTDAKEVADYITNGIEGNKELATNAPNLALRALFVAAGAEYNDSGTDKTKTAPWGETVTHKAGHYYLNGLGDITEEQMSLIYASTYPTYVATNLTSAFRIHVGGEWKVRTNLRKKAVYPIYDTVELNACCYTNSTIEVLVISHYPESLEKPTNLEYTFYNCVSLKAVIGNIVVNKVNNQTFKGCAKLQEVKLKTLKQNLTFADSPLISKESISYIISNAAPTSAITITLHADAYARLNPDLEENADIKSALEAQPLITLVSA